MLVVSAKQMREIEENSLNYDLSMPRLMENAGSAAATAITKKYAVDNIGCVVFSGSGNNGGDGFVVARRLYEQGAHVLLVLVDGEPKSAQAKQMFDFLSVLEIPILSMESDIEAIKGYSMNADLIVDAIYGIGFHGSLRDKALLACEIINSVPAAVVALDTPSGIESDQGIISKGAVKADFTVAFELLKPLHILPTSAKYCGEIETVPIGIPTEAYANVKSKFNFITPSKVWESIPTRPLDAHKGMYGRLLAICGCAQYRGAAVMAVKAAYRSGVGICSLAAPELVCSTAAASIPEVILKPLKINSQNQIDFSSALPLLEKEISKSNAVLFGCGFGDDPCGKDILELLIKKLRRPLVIDADGLNILANNLDLLHQSKNKIILTPHPGEMARLLSCSTEEVQSDRISAASGFAKQYNVYVVLKGAGTIVATPKEDLYINETGGPGLAKAGSGDLLAGILASLLAQGLSPADAANAAVWLHGTSGDRCAKRLSVAAMLPHEILDDLASIFLEADR